MPETVTHSGFTVVYDSVVDQLEQPLDIFAVVSGDAKLRHDAVRVTAYWDTGAISSFISESLRKRLLLRTTGHTEPVYGLSGNEDADVTYISIKLPDDTLLKNKKILVGNLGGSEMLLIGMDIISEGEFSVRKIGGKTSFSFIMPPPVEDPKAQKKVNLLINRKRSSP
jgi:hypothetical protein